MTASSIAIDDPALALSPPGTKALRRVFLTARWHALALLNWQIDSAILEPLVPPGTELDFHQGKTFVSLVGFLFLDTRLLGASIPFHRNFEEVNLRYYVKRSVNGEVRRGVAFVQEIVPRRAIATVARWYYNEPYVALPMRHMVTGPVRESFSRTAATAAAEKPEPATSEATGSESSEAGTATYSWKRAGRWETMGLSYHGRPQPLAVGTHEEFIAEHYFGYCGQRDGGTVEYQVAHPPWRFWKGDEAHCEFDPVALYGEQFSAVLSQPPTTAFLAEGSAVAVLKPQRLSGQEK